MYSASISQRIAPGVIALTAGLFGMAVLSGCISSIRSTDPARTATEQFLLSKAAARAVDQLSVEGLRGRRVFMDDEYFAAAEAKFVLGELRAKLLMGGAQLVPKRELAQIIVEVRSDGVGIDRSDFLLGIPSILISAGGENGTSGRTPLVTPELAVLKNVNQVGVASVAFVAYWAETGEIVAASGPFIGRSMRDDWWIFGFGSRTIGDIPTTDPVDE